MLILIAYCSDHGSTRGIADRIGGRLRTDDLQVDIVSVDKAENVETYDAVIVGSAIHNQQWLPAAEHFLTDQLDVLASRPVWLFSVSSIGETSSFLNRRVASVMRRVRREPAAVSRCRATVRPVGHRNFAGAIERDHWTTGGDLFLRLCGGSYGDHRDWADIDRWADIIANAVLVQRTRPPT